MKDIMLLKVVKVLLGWYLLFFEIVKPGHLLYSAYKANSREYYQILWHQTGTQLLFSVFLLVILFGFSVLKIVFPIFSEPRTSVYMGKYYYTIRNTHIIISFFFMIVHLLIFIPILLISTLFRLISETVVIIRKLFFMVQKSI
ncbi:hypothetical protein [Rummeliibacillus suwonensis]|uniref:hypothetical protein n=1 Tax=Rummeliibacillus suwonensis TaxID=1306154 RepID=UPI0011B5276A|nr:hypothetical protein [Rummeliibacillus suwonensis]